MTEKRCSRCGKMISKLEYMTSKSCLACRSPLNLAPYKVEEAARAVEDSPSQPLKPAQIEALALLAEECAEVIQIISKTLRFGLDSYHPDDPQGPRNRHLLEKEISHVLLAIDILNGIGATNPVSIRYYRIEKLERINKWLKHQQLSLTA